MLSDFMINPALMRRLDKGFFFEFSTKTDYLVTV